MRDGEDHAAPQLDVGCTTMTREKFLKEFLGALGAIDLIITKSGEDHICGTAIFNHKDPTENQNFCWHQTNINLPSAETYKLTKLIKENNLLSIDRIMVGRPKLMKQYNERWDSQLSADEFGKIVDSLESIEVAMVDDGEENDAFFIHE